MSSQYLLPCSCGRRLPVDLSQAGNRIRCECGEEQEVPTLLRLKQLEPADRDQASPTREQESSWGTRQRFALVGALTCLAGIAFAIWSFATRPRIIDVAEYPPMATLQLWESLKRGIDLPPAPMEVMLFSQIQWHYRWTLAGLVVAAVGAAVMIVSLALGHRSLARQPPPV